MTREEAIEVLNTYDMSEDNDDTEFKSAIALAIEALEQKPKSEWQQDHEILKAYSDGASAVLDNVRAEIDGLLNDEDSNMYAHGVMDCLEIIDKFMAEEDKA